MRRGLGVIRVSEVGDREGERFVSPTIQDERIAGLAERENIRLVQPAFRELDVSGKRSLAKRPGLLRAVEMVERGEADVIIVAYFDRLVRNLRVQAEVLERVERAGGQVLAADFGVISEETATQWLSATMMGAFAEFMQRQTAEKTHGPKQRAIAAGIPTFPHIPAGYRQDPITRRLVVMPGEAALIRQVFEKRAEGASHHELRDWLRAHGLQRSTRGIQAILHNRIYLGELRFGRPKSKGGAGEMVNIYSHEAIVDKALFDSVQAMRVLKGPRGGAVSRHPGLLARMGVLRCATCGRGMIIEGRRGRPQGKIYPGYRCPPIGDCPLRASISQVVVDGLVADYVKQVTAGEEGSYSAAEQVQAAEAAVEATSAALKRAIRNLASLEDTTEAQDVVAELRAEHEAAVERLEALQRSLGPARVLTTADWGSLSLAAQRDLVRALIRRIEVGPATHRGGTQSSQAQSGRVRILPFTE